MDYELLMRQATMTSEEYFNRAREVLEKSGLPYTATDVIALAAISAQDFHSMVINNGPLV